jgi:uncharacterized membrane protein YcaP (DUF421 family)
VGSVIRGLAVYGFLLLLFRLAGKRALSEITTFDAVVLLIISEAVQQGLIDGDESMTNAFLLVVTLIGADVAFSLLSGWFKKVSKLVNDVPLVIVEDGKPIEERMRKARVEEDDVMEAARELQGLRRMEDIEYAILERGGKITIVPKAA